MKQFRTLAVILQSILILPLILKAQQPVLSSANNECSGASSIVFSVPFADNNIGATQSQPANSCNGFITPGQAKDVWFKFTYTTNMDSIVVDPGPNPNADIVTELFSGSCGSLVNISCSNFAEPNSNNQSEGFYLGALGLTPGSEYYFRVYGSNGIETPFTVLAKTASNLPPPANDECSTAQTINAGQTVGGNSIGATQSLAPLTCNGFTSSDAKDVWFRFQKIPQVQSLIVFPEALDVVVEIRSACATSATSIACSDIQGTTSIEQISLTGLNNGSFYFVRVYGRNGTAGLFSIKLTSPPVNDNCSTASELLPNIAANGKTIDASQSEGPSAVCGGSSDDDVWYSFTMAANMDSLVLNPGFFFNPVLELRTGPCSTSAAISCSHTGGKAKLPVSTLTVGTKYFVRIYSHSGNQGTFSLTLFQGSGQGSGNDQCSNPEAVNPAIGTSVSGNNNGATQSFGGIPCGGLGSTSAKDVWFSFTRTAQRDTLYIDGLGSLDVLADIRSACFQDSLKVCMDLDGSGEKIMDLSELSEGRTYLLRVYGRNGSTGDFSFRFTENTFVPDPPANNDCFTATLLTVGTACNSVTGTTVSSNATANLALPGCASGTAANTKDVWYRFVANSTKMIVKLTCDSGFDGVAEVLSGSCFAPSSLTCGNDFPASNDPDFPATEEIYLSGLSSGTSYYVRVFGNNGTTGTFSICAYNPNCNSTSAGLTLGSTSVLSNQAITTSLTNAQGAVQYQLKPASGITWKTIANSQNTTGDSIVLASAQGGNFAVRTKSRTGECYPAFSTEVPVSIRCATPFTEPNSLVFITQFKLGSINNTSTRNLLGGSVEDFSAQTAQVCKGTTYQLGVKTNIAGSKLLAWADFNQDGDFSDADENLLNGAISSNLILEYPIQIPANATSGNCRFRIVVVAASSPISGENPCADGPYSTGEIEEYSLNISSGTTAAAGSDQIVGCPGFANLSGNSPGAGNTGLWSVVSGSGVISNPSSANTTVNNLSSGVNVFRWSINNSCGNTSDDVSINFNVFNPVALGNDTIVCPPASINLNGPSSGISSYLWSDGSTGNSLLVTIPGTYWLQVQTAEGCTFRDSILINVCVTNRSLLAGGEFTLVPNPSSGLVFLNSSESHPEPVRITLMDASGRLISQKITPFTKGLNRISAPDNLPEGLYIIRLEEEGRKPVLLRFIRE